MKLVARFVGATICGTILVIILLFNAYFQGIQGSSKKRIPFLIHDPDPLEENLWKPPEKSNVHGHHHHENPIGAFVEPYTSKPTAEGVVYNQSLKSYKVAVGLGITTRGQEVRDELSLLDLPFFKRLLDSFCRTISNNVRYNFYLAHDHDDPYFRTNSSHSMFTSVFNKFIHSYCGRNHVVSLHLVLCQHAGRPAWAQNDAMMAAYMDNNDYYFRVNDDTILQTSGWTEGFIEELSRLRPPNVGVTGPWFRDGNTAILTHDFVHRTHIDIFGFYYPRTFTDWFADDWITNVYWPTRTRKVHHIRITHTMEMGNRYVVHFEKARQVRMEVEIGKLAIRRWLEGGLGNDIQNYTKVVALPLYGDWDDMTYGALRYAQLTHMLYPGWRVRVYAEKYSSNSSLGVVLPYVLRKLMSVGIEVVYISGKIAESVVPELWPFFIIDDVNVTRFLVRSPNMRPSERELPALKHWENSLALVHCIRDHPRHAAHALPSMLFGAVGAKLRDILPSKWHDQMSKYQRDTEFLSFLWNLTQDVALCHDSVSCKQWGHSVAYPIMRSDAEFVGQEYDANDQPRGASDPSDWGANFSLPECVHLKETGFPESLVRMAVQKRPVLWSQDYHVTPIMGVKSLLQPIGVRVMDHSLSYYCGHIGTCAENLRVIRRDNGMQLTPELISQFYWSYRDDPQMRLVDVFICALPVAMFEAFMPFNKSILVLATTRYEQGRNQALRWLKLNENLKKISQQPNNVIAANNLYDAKYIEYFTGLKVRMLPHVALYLHDRWSPSVRHRQFLLTPIHNTELAKLFAANLSVALANTNVSFDSLRTLYPQYLFSDLCQHPGIIYVPYQVSMISLSEQYHMAIPLFFPSLDLLARWHIQYQAVRQRSWAGYLQRVENSSAISGVRPGIPDPNDDVNADSIRHWLQFSDFYTFPHIIYYDSITQLADRLRTTNLTAVSEAMWKHNQKMISQQKTNWADVLSVLLSRSRQKV